MANITKLIKVISSFENCHINWIELLSNLNKSKIDIMKSNKLIALGIAIITLLPLSLAYFNDDASNMGFKLLMMLATMGGAVASVVVGCSSSHA